MHPKFVNMPMEYNNDYHPPLMNVKSTPSKTSSVFILNSLSVTSINDEICSSKNQIHEKIKYSCLYITQERGFCRASDIMTSQIK